MRMQDSEEWQSSRSSGQEWQTGLEYGEYRANTGRFEPGQQQKIYPQEERGSIGRAAALVSIILSSIAFGPAIVGIVASGIVLYYSNGQHYMLVGGIMGLIGSILALLLLIAVFVINIVALARAELQRRRQM